MTVAGSFSSDREFVLGPGPRRLREGGKSRKLPFDLFQCRMKPLVVVPRRVVHSFASVLKTWWAMAWTAKGFREASLGGLGRRVAIPSPLWLSPFVLYSCSHKHIQARETRATSLKLRLCRNKTRSSLVLSTTAPVIAKFVVATGHSVQYNLNYFFSKVPY